MHCHKLQFNIKTIHLEIDKFSNAPGVIEVCEIRRQCVLQKHAINLD